MSDNWVSDIEEMHNKFGVRKWMNDKLVEGDRESIQQFLRFRMSFLEEELEETKQAAVDGDAEEIVDGLIDLCVVAIGTLDAYGIDATKAWNEVLRANLSKEPGVKPTRPNPLGLPDLIKPEGWKGPSHEDNHGNLAYTFQKSV